MQDVFYEGLHVKLKTRAERGFSHECRYSKYEQYLSGFIAM